MKKKNNNQHLPKPILKKMSVSRCAKSIIAITLINLVLKLFTSGGYARSVDRAKKYYEYSEYKTSQQADLQTQYANGLISQEECEEKIKALDKISSLIEYVKTIDEKEGKKIENWMIANNFGLVFSGCAGAYNLLMIILLVLRRKREIKRNNIFAPVFKKFCETAMRGEDKNELIEKEEFVVVKEFLIQNGVYVEGEGIVKECNVVLIARKNPAESVDETDPNEIDPFA